MNIFARIVAIFLIAEGLMRKLMNKSIVYRVIVLKQSAHFRRSLFTMKRDQLQKVDQTVPAAQVDPATLATIKSYFSH
jgi:hypothetical protein